MSDEKGKQQATAPETDPQATPEPPKPEPPAAPRKWAGKYDSPEAMEKGYRELEKKLGEKSKPARPAPSQSGLELGETDQADTPEQEADILARVGKSEEDLWREWHENDGKLLPETYRKFGQHGVRKEFINEHMALRVQAAAQTQARVRAEAAEMLKVEPERLNEVLRQMATHVPEQYRADIEARLADPTKWRGAIRDLEDFAARQQGSANSKPIITGDGSKRPGGAPFSSAGEMLAAMAEARKTHGHWSKDPQLMRRLQATDTSIRSSIK